MQKNLEIIGEIYFSKVLNTISNLFFMLLEIMINAQLQLHATSFLNIV